MESIGDKIVYPANSNPGAIKGVTYKEELILRIAQAGGLLSQEIVNKANNIIKILDKEREDNVTMSK